MRFILIVATPRSASTTLQRIIHSLPNANICGENKAIVDLLYFYEKIINTNLYSFEVYEQNNKKPCFYNCFSKNEMISNIKKTIIDMYKFENCDIIGCKQICFFQKTHLISLFLNLFPESKIICNIHDNVYEQQYSSFLKNENSLNYLKEYTYELVKFSKEHSNNCILIKKSDVLSYNSIKKVFYFINEAPICENEYKKILDNKME